AECGSRRAACWKCEVASSSLPSMSSAAASVSCTSADFGNRSARRFNVSSASETLFSCKSSVARRNWTDASGESDWQYPKAAKRTKIRGTNRRIIAGRGQTPREKNIYPRFPLGYDNFSVCATCIAHLAVFGQYVALTQLSQLVLRAESARFRNGSGRVVRYCPEPMFSR